MQFTTIGSIVCIALLEQGLLVPFLLSEKQRVVQKELLSVR